MTNVVMWALLTGGITGAVWVAIVLLSRQHRLAVAHRALLDDTGRHLEQLDATTRRLTEIEDRLDFAERLLRQRDEAEPLAPPR